MNKRGVIIKGNSLIIALPGNRKKADKLYKFLTSLLKENKISANVLSSGTGVKYKQLSNEKIGNLQVIIAHSRGASMICEQFKTNSFPQTKTIILLDPLLKHCKTWNNLHKINKALILSTEFFNHQWKGNTNKMKNLQIIHCDHYFTDKHKELKKLIMPLVKKSF